MRYLIFILCISCTYVSHAQNADSIKKSSFQNNSDYLILKSGEKLFFHKIAILDTATNTPQFLKVDSQYLSLNDLTGAQIEGFYWGNNSNIQLLPCLKKGKISLFENDPNMNTKVLNRRNYIVSKRPNNNSKFICKTNSNLMLLYKPNILFNMAKDNPKANNMISDYKSSNTLSSTLAFAGIPVMCYSLIRCFITLMTGGADTPHSNPNRQNYIDEMNRSYTIAGVVGAAGLVMSTTGIVIHIKNKRNINRILEVYNQN